MVTNIQSIEADGSIRMDGETNRNGPYRDVGTVEAMAGRFIAIFRTVFHGNRPIHPETPRVVPAPASRLIVEI